MRFSFGVLLTLITPAATAALYAQEPTYWKDIRPLLRRHCTSCHSAKHLKEIDVSGGLALDSYEAILKAPTKQTVRVGKSADSLLLHLLLTPDENKRMPLGGTPLSEAKIRLVRQWIDGGAKEGVREVAAESVSVVKTGPVRKLPVLIRTSTDLPKQAGSKLVLSLKVGPLAPVVAAAFSPDGKLLATGSYGQATVWDLEEAKPIKVLTNVLGAVNDLRFSPKGDVLAVAGGQPSAKGDLRLFRVADWKLLGVLRGHEDVVFSVAYDPAGRRLASASFDKTVRLWDLNTLKAERVFDGHSDFVYSVAFAPDGSWLASASKDRSVRIVDTETGKGLFTLGGVEQDVLAVAVSPDGKAVVSSGFDNGIRWWNAKTGERTKVQPGHRVAVHELAFSGDGKLLVSAGADSTVRLWNADGSPQKTLSVGSMVYAVAVSPDGSRIASGSFDGLVRLWDAKSGKFSLTLLALPARDETFDWLAITPEGYVVRSEGMSTIAKWRAGKAEGPAVWQQLDQPQLVRRVLSGETVPPPHIE
jgi:WD40 repeat protein